MSECTESPEIYLNRSTGPLSAVLLPLSTIDELGLSSSVWLEKTPQLVCISWVRRRTVVVAVMLAAEIHIDMVMYVRRKEAEAVATAGDEHSTSTNRKREILKPEGPWWKDLMPNVCLLGLVELLADFNW